MILAIDTSTAQAGVALMRGSWLVAELSWAAAGNHSSTLATTIEYLLELQEIRPADLGAVVVASGPGSFSGLRVGISEAKGLAMALDIPLAGVSTLDATAFQMSASSARVWAVLPAGRGQVYAAGYDGGWRDFRRTTDYMLVSTTEAALAVDGLVTGEAADDIAASSSAGRRICIQPQGWRLRRAGFLAELGRRYLEAGGPDQRDVLEPLYLRRSAAEEKRMGEPT